MQKAKHFIHSQSLRQRRMLWFDLSITVPVIFDKLSAKQWLDPVFRPSDATLAAVLAPFPSALMEAHDVSPSVISLRMKRRIALSLLRTDSSGLFNKREG